MANEREYTNKLVRVLNERNVSCANRKDVMYIERKKVVIDVDSQRKEVRVRRKSDPVNAVYRRYAFTCSGSDELALHRISEQNAPL
jgi:hypothetical protein